MGFRTGPDVHVGVAVMRSQTLYYLTGRYKYMPYLQSAYMKITSKAMRLSTFGQLVKKIYPVSTVVYI